MGQDCIVVLVKDPGPDKWSIDGQEARVFMRFYEPPEADFLERLAKQYPNWRVYSLTGATTYNVHVTDEISEARRLYASGYCPTSGRYLMASRIDRPDWKEFMADAHPGGMSWVDALGDAAGDQFRRIYSRDKITLDAKTYQELKRLTPGYGRGGVNEYREVVER